MNCNATCLWIKVRTHLRPTLDHRPDGLPGRDGQKEDDRELFLDHALAEAIDLSLPLRFHHHLAPPQGEADVQLPLVELNAVPGVRPESFELLPDLGQDLVAG